MQEANPVLLLMKLLFQQHCTVIVLLPCFSHTDFTAFAIALGAVQNLKYRSRI